MPYYLKSCLFLQLITLKHKKVVEEFVKKTFMVKNTHLLNGQML